VTAHAAPAGEIGVELSQRATNMPHGLAALRILPAPLDEDLDDVLSDLRR
jgi:hypothetical protein